MKVNLNSLFKYYLLSLKLDDILDIKIKLTEVKATSQIKLIDKIQTSFKAARKVKKRFKFKLSQPFDKRILIKLENSTEDYNACFEELSFLEKTESYCHQVKKPLHDLSVLETDPNFTYAKQPFYQYAIFFHLAEIGSGRKKETVPLFILSFESKDVDHEFITPHTLFEQIKKYMGKEYDHSIDEKNLLKPVLLLNPSVIETYNCPNPDFEFTNLDDVEQNVNAYIKNYELRANKDASLEDNIYLCAFPPKMTSGLIRIYNQVLLSGANSLLKSYFSIHPSKITKVHVDHIDTKDIITTESLVKSYSKHIGAFDSNNPLAETQRIAMSCFLNSQNLVLPVNGAPGTGKTSLLRCVFGQYIVESALEAYDQYLDKKIIKFRTPIVCSSTNNQALLNIAEGIDSGFSAQIKSNPDNLLYERWINYIIDNSEQESEELQLDDEFDPEESAIMEETEYLKNINNIDLSNQLFVPSIKNVPKSYAELNKSELATIILDIKQHPEYFIECFHKYKPNHISINDNLQNQLIQIAEYFYQEIKSNNEVISNLDIRDNFFSELSNFERYIFEKYTAQKKSLREIQKSLFSLFNSKELWLRNIEKIDILSTEVRNIDHEIEKFKNNIAELITIFPEYSEKGLTITELFNVISESYILCYPIEKIKMMPLYIKEKDRIYTQRFSVESSQIKEDAKEDLLFAKSSSRLISKVLNLLGKGKLSKTIKNIDHRLKYKMQTAKENISLEAENVALGVVQGKLNQILSKILKIKAAYSASLETQKNFKKVVDHHKNYCSNLLIFEIIDIKKFLELSGSLDEAIKIRNKKAKLDVKERTDNFYYALHLIEALFFMNQDFSSEITCPWCKNPSLYRSKTDTNSYVCSECKAKYTKNNPNNPDLTYKQITAILKAKQYKVDGVRYQVDCNKGDDGKIWINIRKSKGINNIIDFNSLLPIFPMINLTCNSFGSIVANDKNEIPENLFDFLLIDEAGTISPSKMIILYCAKRAMLFGDAKQLKPVFKYYSSTEYKLLYPYMKNIDDKKLVNEYFSCAADDDGIGTANSSIHVANNCCQIILPYNASKLEGDIWLKEHFRCKDPIIEIANELTYENEIIPQAKGEGYLLFMESKGIKTTDNKNQIESQMIVDYIISQKDKLCNLIKQPSLSDEEYYKLIGVITPFKNQEQNLIELLEDKGLMNNPKVGTVHKFQGSERKIIIFSTVYDSGTTENLFFNREDTSMINVAVTRAKEIFICFGREKLLNKPGTNSGLMVSKILANMDASRSSVN